MFTRTSILVYVSALLFWSIGTANSEERDIPPYKGSAAFESMKKLAGSWEGTQIMGEKEKPVKVGYKVSSNGSTVVETLFTGTKHEMITVYHEEGDTLSMTHYCALGNQPQMDLVKVGSNRLEFALADTKHIDVAKDGHMHGLVMTMTDNDHLLHQWTMYEKGQEGGVTTLKLARVQ